MYRLVSFLPILLFVTVYVGSSIYFSYNGVENAFYQISPTVAIIPSIILAWVMHKGITQQKMDDFLDGIRHRDIIVMCIIFLLAGAFSTVTSSIGSVDATVNLALSLIPTKLLLLGLFITAAFISTAIGTSMGTIATIAPIASMLANQGAFPVAVGMATVVGGAMFGDNLSIISDTTIASVMSQQADMKAKLKLNAKVALVSAILTAVILLNVKHSNVDISLKAYSLVLVTPYVVLLTLALLGINVFVVLISAISFAGMIGFIFADYSIVSFSNDIAKGFNSMQEILLLSLLVGGLSGLSSNAFKQFSEYLTETLVKTNNKKIAQLLIAKIVSIFDILLANNTVAIVFSGKIAKTITTKYGIPAHYSAAWLDIFSCVFQGLIPYGAQILLASSIAGISPLSITPHVYYCFILALVSVIAILTNNKLKEV